MRRYDRLFLTFLILLISYTASAQCSTSKHHIVFIHGIASNQRAFGHWDKYLDKYHKDECLQSHFFEYDTGNNKLALKDFVSSFDVFMKKPQFSVGKVSIIAHSQGGLISLFWLKKLLDESDEMKNRIHGLMTMATPYFGAKIANLGLGLGTYILPILGKLELEGMKIGSRQVEKTHELLNNQNFLAYLKTKKFISVSALFAKNIFDIEGDFAVAPFSSNPNINLGPIVSKHYNIHGVHLRFNLSRTPATTYVTKSCLRKPYKCRNSSLGIFEKEFLSHRLVNIDHADDINTFAVYLKFELNNLPKGPIIVGRKGIDRGLAFKFHHIRDGLYYYKGRLRVGGAQGELAIFINGERFLIPVMAGQTTFFTH